jgi:SNF2 family DNA or RNA helicase
VEDAACEIGLDEARWDDDFARVRRELEGFTRVKPLRPPRSFRGTLRDYQQMGVGWMSFLRRFGFGGCLADDMGLGKTVQVLALLEARRRELVAREDRRPSLVVVPRSLVFNWREEAARFAPALKILDLTVDREARDAARFDGADVVLTTYGLLRRDAVRLRHVRFDYAILDEAQAIKNASSDSAKAARLLDAEHRLALSGTPIENHLGELWSLFEFLNPGLLGSAGVFQKATSSEPDEQERRTLARALRPFFLRRTKAEVAPELPPRVDKTVWCELGPTQRADYEELLQHFRASLLGRIDAEGLGASRMHVLEALLRLRQAACHPGLIDPARREESSAKTALLLEELDVLQQEGHKALVFSQFTSLLDLLHAPLERAGIAFEVLDGRTRDRATRVERFQTDPACKVLLASLKAGGLGLNLTAAQYVFVLDPWWNPAAEAQAIDRAHRIGQDKSVFAFRFVAKGTVEEKILQLQDKKRALAESILSSEGGGLRGLTRKDVELLLS